MNLEHYNYTKNRTGGPFFAKECFPFENKNWQKLYCTKKLKLYEYSFRLSLKKALWYYKDIQRLYYAYLSLASLYLVHYVFCLKYYLFHLC